MRERERYEFLVARDGEQAAREFMERTLAIYIEESCRRGPFKDSIDEIRDMLKREGEK